MEPRELARLLALARIGMGSLALAFPGLVAGPWVGAGGRGPAARVLTRAFAGRDLALGLGLLTALRRGAPARGWLEGGMLADAADFTATLVQGDDLPPGGRALGLAMAGGGTVIGAVLARALSGDPAGGPRPVPPVPGGGAMAGSPPESGTPPGPPPGGHP